MGFSLMYGIMRRRMTKIADNDIQAILYATAKHEYPFRPELEEASAAVKRIAAGINEAIDFKAKQATVRELVERVDNWKGHDVGKFGPLHIDDHFTVIKADQPREYHVFLFEKMMLCCKEIIPEGKKQNKNLREDQGTSETEPPEKNKLDLKGRIFVSNIKEATILPSEPGGELSWQFQTIIANHIIKTRMAPLDYWSDGLFLFETRTVTTMIKKILS